MSELVSLTEADCVTFSVVFVSGPTSPRSEATLLYGNGFREMKGARCLVAGPPTQIYCHAEQPCMGHLCAFTLVKCFHKGLRLFFLKWELGPSGTI